MRRDLYPQIHDHRLAQNSNDTGRPKRPKAAVCSLSSTAALRRTRTGDSLLEQRALQLSRYGLINWISAKEGPKLGRAAIAPARHFETWQGYGHFSHVDGLGSDTYHSFHSC